MGIRFSIHPIIVFQYFHHRHHNQNAWFACIYCIICVVRVLDLSTYVLYYFIISIHLSLYQATCALAALSLAFYVENGRGLGKWGKKIGICEERKHTKLTKPPILLCYLPARAAGNQVKSEGNASETHKQASHHHHQPRPIKQSI